MWANRSYFTLQVQVYFCHFSEMIWHYKCTELETVPYFSESQFLEHPNRSLSLAIGITSVRQTDTSFIELLYYERSRWDLIVALGKLKTSCFLSGDDFPLYIAEGQNWSSVNQCIALDSKEFPNGSLTEKTKYMNVRIRLTVNIGIFINRVLENIYFCR